MESRKSKERNALSRFILSRIDFRTQMVRRQFPRERSSAGAQNFRSQIYPVKMTICAAKSDLATQRSRNCRGTLSQLQSNLSFVQNHTKFIFFFLFKTDSKRNSIYPRIAIYRVKNVDIFWIICFNFIFQVKNIIVF